MNYILITSAYNEAKNIRFTIDSVLKQAIKPKIWLIVNDGSTDDTGMIIEDYSLKHDWIHILNKKNDNINIPGQHAMNNLYYAIKHIPSEIVYSFIGHLDADIIIDRKDYYEYQINRMNEDPFLGICSGVTYYYNNSGIKKIVLSEPWHTVGGLKFYRRKCFEEISPIPADIGWDGIDEFKAMYRGWKTKKYYELGVNHLSKQKDITRKLNSNQFYYYGISTYRRGRPIWFALGKTIKTIKSYSLRCGLIFIKGYISSFINSDNKLHTKEEIDFIKRFDRNRVSDRIKLFFHS